MASFFRSFVNVCSNATGSFASASIPATSSSWTVDPAEYHDLDLQVHGTFAGGCVRYAGLDNPLVAGSRQVPVHIVVHVNVLVSHENLVPLVRTNVQHDQQRRSWSLQVETPGLTELPFGMVNAGINVQVLLAFKSGRPSLDEKMKSAPGVSHSTEKATSATDADAFVPFRNVQVHATNLSHEFVESSSEPSHTSNSTSVVTPIQANPDEPPSYFDTVTGDSESNPLAAVQSLQLSTSNGHIHLSPSNPWRVGNSALFKSTNGSIEVSGPLRIVSSVNDAPPNPFASSSSSLNEISANGGIVVKTTNGRALAHVQGSPSVFASSTNGRVTINADACGTVLGKSTNGRVEVFAKGPTQSVSANSVNGRVDIMAESVTESIEAKCVNGSVGATVFPGRSPLSLLAESTNGSVAVVAAQVPPSARIEGKSYSGKVQVAAAMADQVNNAKLEGSSKLGSVRLQVNAPNAGWPTRSDRAKSSPAGGSKASFVVVRQGTEHQPPQSATVVGTSSLGGVEVSLGDASNIRT